MTKKEKKEIIGVIAQILIDGGYKDFMNGLLTYIWNPKNTKTQFSIYKAAERIFDALNIEKL